MLLKNLGQTFQYDHKIFTIGGMATDTKRPEYGPCGIIKRIWTTDRQETVALCDFGSRKVFELPLKELEPVEGGAAV